MFTFENPYYLFGLVVVVILAALYCFSVVLKRRRLQRLGDAELVQQLLQDVSKVRPHIKVTLCLLALTCFILALARPQFGTSVDTHERHGIEAIVALDISNSMMAQDVKPTRLEKSKMLMVNLFKSMKDNQIGLVAYAGDAFVQMPISSDFGSAEMFLDNLEPSSINVQGTDFARALDVCTKSFSDREGVNRAIFLITDGEDNEGGGVEAARQAAEQGIHVYVLGVGSANGAPVPQPQSNGYFKDDNGDNHISKLNEDACRQIAKAGNGAYIHVDNNSDALKQLEQYVDKLSKTKLDSKSYSEYNEQFQGFVIIGLFLLILDVCILARKNNKFRDVELFHSRHLFHFHKS